jgi:RHS repeat-associated protein
LLYSIEAADSTRHYYHFDQSGSTLFLTDDNANVTDTYAITPFGESVAHSGSTDNPFTWLGQLGAMQEGSTSLFYLRARYYDSATARFLSRDPLQSRDPREINPYQYAADNPVTNDDATGLRVNNRVAIESARSMFNYNYPCYYETLQEGRNGSSWNRLPSEPSRAWGRDSEGSNAPLFDRLGSSSLQNGLPYGEGPGGRSTGLRYLDLSLIGSVGARGRE